MFIIATDQVCEAIKLYSKEKIVAYFNSYLMAIVFNTSDSYIALTAID